MKGWIQGYILGEITDLEFENHKNVKKCILRTLKLAGTKICSIRYQKDSSEESTHCAMEGIQKVIKDAADDGLVDLEVVQRENCCVNRCTVM